MVPQGRVRRRLRVRGTVQGVGFRPYVYRLATELGLTGYVLNDTAGVLIEVEGPEAQADRFAELLPASAPVLASITGVECVSVTPEGSDRFDILASGSAPGAPAPISPDAATCEECLAEIFDPAQRRYRYAFTNCTNCGPRFTIATGIPYDRANTTMAGFSMCEECKAEYEDPADRRFHAQPIACPRCGPRLQLVDGAGSELPGDPIAVAARMLQEGRIVAVKGLGGFHLACDALSEPAVARLRRRKGREEKPLAVMVPDIDALRGLVQVDAEEEHLLRSPHAPILLLRRRGVGGGQPPARAADVPDPGGSHWPGGAPSQAGGAGSLAASVAPGNRYLGVMLPYTPLHHLLLAELGSPVVLTSGNISEEPMAHRNAEARSRLGDIADVFLVHDRPIRVRCDDSVVRSGEERSFPIRRARGYAPAPLTVQPGFARPVLAAGPELKHTFCLGSGEQAILSHHIGDLENFETMESFVDAVEHLTRIFSIDPEVVTYDLHPEYLATKWALGVDIADKVGVQHHHAHIASCLADNGATGSVIGLALDGTGFGDDGTIWGCEVLVCDNAGYERRCHLRNVPLPGGAAAVREPWRMGAVYLDAAFGTEAPDLGLAFARSTGARWGPVLQMARRGLNSPPASSAGRLFDAAAAICGLRETVSYEGQAAAELEHAADPAVHDAYPCTPADGEIDGVELLGALAGDLLGGAPVPIAAARFHNGLAAALVTACKQLRDEEGLGRVALSGGSFQNVLLLERVSAGLTDAGFEVLTHHRVPPNDGGISLGQAVVAGARMGHAG